MAFSLVQQKAVTSSSGTATSITVTFDSTATLNDLLTIVFRADTVEANVTDPAGWTLSAVHGNNNAAAGCIQFLYKISDGTETSAMFSTTATASHIGFMEFSGATTWTVDKAPAIVAPSTGGTSLQTNSTTTLTSATEVAIAGFAQYVGSNGGSEAIDSGFTALDTAGTTRLVHGYLLTAATTALAPTGSWATSRGRTAGIITFMDTGVASVQRGLGASSMGVAPPSSGAFSMGINL